MTLGPLGLRACAKKLGISHVRLHALWKEKRVPRNADGSFELEAVRAAFERTKDPAQRSKLAKQPAAAPVAVAPPPPPATPAPVTGATSAAAEDGPGFNEVRTKREAVKLKEAELDLAEREKELMSVDDARKAWGGLITAVQSRLLLLPAKLAPRVAVLPDVLECQTLIDREIKAALSDLSEYTPHA